MRAVTCNFIDNKCSNCGECCGHLLPLSGADIKRLRRYVKKHKISQQSSLNPLTPDILQNCPFLIPDKTTERCAVYPARPDICRLFDCGPHRYGELPGDIKKYRPVNMYRLLEDINNS